MNESGTNSHLSLWALLQMNVTKQIFIQSYEVMSLGNKSISVLVVTLSSQPSLRNDTHVQKTKIKETEVAIF